MSDKSPARSEADQHPARQWLVVHQGGHKAQERFMLGVQRPTAEESADVGFGDLTTGWSVRFVPNENTVCVGLAAQKPAISVWAAIKLSGLDRHFAPPEVIE